MKKKVCSIRDKVGRSNRSYLHDAHTELSGLVLDLLQLQYLQLRQQRCFSQVISLLFLDRKIKPDWIQRKEQFYTSYRALETIALLEKHSKHSLPSSHSHQTRDFGDSRGRDVGLSAVSTVFICDEDSRSSSHIDFSWFDLQRLFEGLQHLDQALLKLWRLQTHRETVTFNGAQRIPWGRITR